MGGALALDAAWLLAAFLVLLVLAASGIAARRFLLERGGATVECGLRSGRGPWRLGVASYQLDEFCWFGVFGISIRPDECFSRRDLAVVSRRLPTEEEESILGPGRIVVECQLGEPGAPGPAGTAGEGGASGQAGVVGQAGAAGEPDVVEKADAAGQAGVAGQAGAAGEPGVAGKAGVAGEADGSRVGGRPGPGSTDHAVELALAESALTGLLAWLEAAPPGSHLGLVL